MKMRQFRTGAIVLVMLFFACTLVVTGSAVEEKGVMRTIASEAQLNLINELYGRDITVLDYMEKVHPEHLAGVPDSVKKNMADQKMNWWSKEPAPAQSKITNAMPMRATVTVTTNGWKYDWRTIRYWGKTYSNDIAQPSYIYAEAYLINRDTGQTAASTSASSRAGIREITAQQDKLYPDNGQYYVHAWGYIPTPYYAENFAETTVFNFP